MPPTDPSKPDTRTAILEAVERVIVRDGARKTTIDAVVTESGFSKGGVLYHFPSKSALLAGLVARSVAQFEADFQMALDASIAAGEPIERHLIDVHCAPDLHKQTVFRSLLAVIAEEPELLEPARALKRRIEDRLMKNSKDPVLTRIVILAIDGLMHRDLLDFSPLSETDRDAVCARLNGLTEDL